MQSILVYYVRLLIIYSVFNAFVAFKSSCNSVYGSEPGELYEWSFPDAGSAVTLRFRYCPTGTIYPGKPKGDGKADSIAVPNKVRDFYLGETEVTIEQYRAVLGDSGMNELKRTAAKFQSANPQLFELIQNGQGEPAFFVGFSAAIHFCLKLQAFADSERNRRETVPIEARRFRLPSHVEWQYGARGISDARQQSSRPHFNRDLRMSDLSPSAQEKCRELWTKLGRKGQFICTQEQLFDLTLVIGADEKSKLREILSEVFPLIVGGPARNQNGMGSFPWNVKNYPQDRPNAWNIYDCHDNVSEWVLWASSQNRRDELWKTLTEKVANGDTLRNNQTPF